MKSNVAVVAMLFILAPQAFGLAPEPPAIFLDTSPKTQDVLAGGSAEFKISVYSQGEWNRGSVSLELADPPAGVSASFEPSPFDLTDQAVVTMKVKVSPEAPQGKIALKVVGRGVEEKGAKVESSIEVELNIGGVAQPPPPQDQSGQQQPVDVKTTTATTTVTTTVTEVITTRTPTIGTKTASEPSQAADYTLPIGTAGAVVALLTVATVVLLRRK